MRTQDGPIRPSEMRPQSSCIGEGKKRQSCIPAQQVAANVGMATWLFACEGLVGENAAGIRPEALRWLLLSEWQCRCAGLAGQSARNAIYMMRIARGDAAHDGDLQAAAQSLMRLDDELPHLPARDKAFFHTARLCLPAEPVGDKVASIAHARKRT